MTKSKLLILAAAPALVLCSCAKKCSYADFVKAVSEIEKAPKVTEITVKGTIKVEEEGVDIKVEKTTIKEGDVPTKELMDAYTIVLLMGEMNVQLFALAPEDEKVTYYAGSTFKAKTEEATIEWDKYGNCTSIEGEMEGAKVDISAKYTYAD